MHASLFPVFPTLPYPKFPRFILCFPKILALVGVVDIVKFSVCRLVYPLFLLAPVDVCVCACVCVCVILPPTTAAVQEEK